MRNRRDFTVEELFDYSGRDFCGTVRYSEYEMRWEQESNELCRFPELLPLFRLGYELEHASDWPFARVITKEHPSKDKRVPEALYKAFSCCPNIAIVYDHGKWEITSSQKYTYQDFEHYRNEAVFLLRDHLGISHEGKGRDSVRLEQCVR